MSCSLNDRIRIAFNSFEARLIDKEAAIGLIIDGIHNNCMDCREQIKNERDALLDIIEMAVDDQIDNSLKYPLDDITIEQVERLYHEDYIVHCEDGHVMGLYRKAG